jgi:hypothetical protein
VWLAAFPGNLVRAWNANNYLHVLARAWEVLEMPIPANQIVHAELIYKGTVASAGSSAKTMQAVFHYRRQATVVTPTKAALASAWLAANRANFNAVQSLRFTGIGLTVRWVDDALDAPVLTSDTHPGVVTGDSMPLTNAAFLLYQTGLRGRSYKGSKHIYPLAESQTTVLTDDLFNAATLTLLGTLAASLLGAITDSTGNIWVPQVLSKKLSQLKENPTNVVAYDVTTIAVGKRVGTMRHRRVASVY